MADEYGATFTPLAPGSFDLAYRFTADDGTTWTYCDTTGTPLDNPANAAKLTVHLRGSLIPIIADADASR